MPPSFKNMDLEVIVVFQLLPKPHFRIFNLLNYQRNIEFISQIKNKKPEGRKDN